MTAGSAGQEPTPTASGTPVPTPTNTPPPAAPGASGEPAGDASQSKTFSEDYVKDLRKEAADWRTKFQAEQARTAEIAARVDALEREKMTEAERLQADYKKALEEVIPSLRRDNQRLQVQVTAAAKGIVDPEAAAALLDWKAVEQGTSIPDALDALVGSRPWLKAPQTPAPIAPTAPPSASSPATPPAASAPAVYTKSQLKAMTPAEMMAQREAVQRAIAEGRIDYSR